VSLPSNLVAQDRTYERRREPAHCVRAGRCGTGQHVPQFLINADTGSAALQLGQLFGPGTGFWSVGASLTQTLFDAGALLHKHRAADAELDQAERSTAPPSSWRARMSPTLCGRYRPTPMRSRPARKRIMPPRRL